MNINLMCTFVLVHHPILYNRPAHTYRTFLRTSLQKLIVGNGLCVAPSQVEGVIRWVGWWCLALLYIVASHQASPVDGRWLGKPVVPGACQRESRPRTRRLTRTAVVCYDEDCQAGRVGLAAALDGATSQGIFVVIIAQRQEKGNPPFAGAFPQCRPPPSADACRVIPTSTRPGVTCSAKPIFSILM